MSVIYSNDDYATPILTKLSHKMEQITAALNCTRQTRDAIFLKEQHGQCYLLFGGDPGAFVGAFGSKNIQKATIKVG